MSKVSSIRTNETEYSVPVVLTYSTFVNIHASTVKAAKEKVLKMKPKQIRHASQRAIIKTGRIVIVAKPFTKVANA